MIHGQVSWRVDRQSRLARYWSPLSSQPYHTRRDVNGVEKAGKIDIFIDWMSIQSLLTILEPWTLELWDLLGTPLKLSVAPPDVIQAQLRGPIKRQANLAFCCRLVASIDSMSSNKSSFCWSSKASRGTPFSAPDLRKWMYQILEDRNWSSSHANLAGGNWVAWKLFSD